MTDSQTPRVGIVMGSDSDWPVMRAAAEALEEFGVPHEADVVSAHRMPQEMIDYGRDAAGRGLSVIIAGAGGAAHLPGMLAAVTPLPVIGVPVPLAYLDGMDSLLSIVQMPAGVPVATVAVGGARNAGLLAVRVLAATDPANPYGAALAWPARDDAESGHRPGRKAGAMVVLVDGRLVLYVERGGRTLLTWSDEPDLLHPAAAALAEAVGRGALGRLTVEKADGEQLLGRGDPPLREALTAAGFVSTPRGLRLRTGRA